MERMSILGAVGEVDAADWDALAGDDSPFVGHAYLAAVEASLGKGFEPHHAVLERGGRLVAAVPFYRKTTTEGEFLWDGPVRLPRLVAGPPFTPITGRRLLAPDPLDALRLVRAVEERTDAAAIHFHFLPLDEARALAAIGYEVLDCRQELVLETDRWRTLDDWLASFASHRRTRLRRELRAIEALGLGHEVLEGDAVDAAALAEMESFYRTLCRRHGGGSDYLGPATWRGLIDLRDRLVLTFATDGDRGRVAGSLCLAAGGRLYGRYWGSDDRTPLLHFDLALYRPLRLALERGWRTFHAGFGDTTHKRQRGFRPVASLIARRYV